MKDITHKIIKKIKSFITMFFIIFITLLFISNQTPYPPTQTIPQIQTLDDLYEWNVEVAPEYVAYIGEANFDGIPQTAYKNNTLKPIIGKLYTVSDSQRRITASYMRTNYKTARIGSQRERDDLPNPTGWPKHNAEVDIILSNGRTYHGWFWNRSHLVAKSLGGTDTKDNLVTGTRMQNVGNNDGDGGIATCETIVRDYLKTHKQTYVDYLAQPVYYEDEPIPRAVIVSIKSEDNTLNAQYITYNAQNGYIIDYKTGTWEETLPYHYNTSDQIISLIMRLLQN